MIALTNLTFKNPECAYLRLESVKYDKRIFFLRSLFTDQNRTDPLPVFSLFRVSWASFFPPIPKKPYNNSPGQSGHTRNLFGVREFLVALVKCVRARANCADFFPGVKKSGAVGSSHEKIRLF